MKTLQEIKDEVARSYGYKDWAELYDAKDSPNVVIDQVAELYASQPFNPWVKTSERLPEIGEYVLTWVPSIKMVARDQYRYFEQLEKSDFVYRGVTHWMPLPTEPKD